MKYTDEVQLLLQADALLGRVMVYAHQPDDLKEFISLLHPSEAARALEKRVNTPYLALSVSSYGPIFASVW